MELLGTPIPSHLILINEFDSRFSLRPSRGISLQGQPTSAKQFNSQANAHVIVELNRLLDGFWEKYAQKEAVESWLKDVDRSQASVPDRGGEGVWMAR
jgi:hypothetical protein